MKLPEIKFLPGQEVITYRQPQKINSTIVESLREERISEVRISKAGEMLVVHYKFGWSSNYEKEDIICPDMKTALNKFYPFFEINLKELKGKTKSKTNIEALDIYKKIQENPELYEKLKMIFKKDK